MLNHQAEIIHVLNISDEMEVSVDNTNYGFFWSDIQPPRSAPARSVESPREDLPPYLLRYGRGTFEPKHSIKPGTWIRIGGPIYECISNPRNLMWGQLAMQAEVQILPISDLYPFRCALVDKGGAENLRDVPIAVWSPTEDTGAHGSYVAYQGYVQASYHDQIDVNTEVLLGSKRFTVTREGLEVSSGIVSLTLRRTGRG